MKKVFTLIVAIVATWSAMATQYQKVTAVSDLADGAVVVMANETAGKISGSCAGKYLNAVDATFANGIATVDGVTEITLTKSGTNWTMKAGNTVLGASGTDFSTNSSSVKTYTISFESNGDVNIASTNVGSGKIYYNAGSPRFKLYTSSTMSPIQLYKKVEGSNPVMTLSASALAFDKKALAEGTATDQKTLTITASDLKNENITVAMKHGTVFSVTPASVASTGGTVSVSYTATAEGEYKDTVVVTGKDVNDTPIVRECAVSVTIDAAAPTGTNVTYNLLQNIDSLHAGDKVFFGTAAKDFVLGQYVSGSNIKGVAATYSNNRHQVTANDLNAYTVSVDANGKYVFTGSDNKYLCDYNSGKNLSSSETLDNKAKWTVTITDDVATIKNVNASGYQILFNKTASPALFSCYTGLDGNTAAVVLYSNNAPAYQEKVLHPALEVTIGGVAVGDTLDWGEVVYDDSWGTEAAPYSEMKSLNVVGTDLPGAISVSVSGSSAFSCLTNSLPATGGSLSLNFETNNQGTYLGTLTISCDTLSKTVVLKAKAVRDASDDPSTKPQITTDKVRVYLNPYFYNESGSVEEMDIFYVSASNLKKNLYCKWLNSDGFSIPTGGKGTMSVSFVGYGDLTYGSTLNLGKDDIENLEVTVYVNAYYNQSYYSQLLFYTPDATNTSVNEVEHIVELVVEMSTEETPDPDPTHDPNVNPSTSIPNVTVTLGGKVLRAGQVRIVSEDGIYDLRGNRVE